MPHVPCPIPQSMQMKAIEKGLRLPSLQNIAPTVVGSGVAPRQWLDRLVATSDADVAFSQAKISALKAGLPLSTVLQQARSAFD